MRRIKVMLRMIGAGFVAGSMLLSLHPARAFHDETATVDVLEPGPSYFSAHAGDVITIRAQSTDGNRTCLPRVSPTENLQPLGEVERVAGDQAYVFQVHQDGTYEYTLPTPLDETGRCSLTIGVATQYEKLMLQASELELNSYQVNAREQPSESIQMREDALALYQQALSLEPEYPETYKRLVGLLLEINIAQDLDIEFGDFDALGSVFLSWPEPTRVTTLDYLEKLAQIYEQSPEWREEKGDDPLFFRGFADFVRTGNAPDVVRELLLGGRGG